MNVSLDPKNEALGLSDEALERITVDLYPKWGLTLFKGSFGC